MNETGRLFSEHGFPWWHLLLAAAVLLIAAWQAYRWMRLPIPPHRRRTLAGLRLLWVALLAWCLWDPSWERLWESRSEVRPTISVVIDHSRSMVAGTAREGEARWQAVRDTADGLARRLTAAGADDVRWYAVGERLAAWTPTTTADAESSRIVDGLARVASERTVADRPHRILLISDGADTDEAGSERLAPSTANPGANPSAAQTSVFPLLLPGLARPPRLGRFSRITTPGTVPLRTRIGIEAGIRLRGYAGQALLAVLSQDGRELDRRPVTGGDGNVVVALDAPAVTAPGLQRYTLSLLDGEQERDRAEVLVAVVGETATRVLWVQGGLGWEYRFVRGAILANKGLALDGLSRLDGGRYLRQYADNNPRPNDGDAMAELRAIMPGYQVIVLADCPTTLVDDATQVVLAEAVRTRGLGVLVQSGDAAQAAAWRSSRLEALLPVRFAGPGDPAVASDVETRRFLAEVDDSNMLIRETEFAEQVVSSQGAAGPLSDLTAMRLTPAGRSSPIWRQGEAGLGTVLADPPRTFRFSAKADSAKPAATVIAEHPTERSASGPRPLLAVQEIDGGRSAFLGVDGLWRWRMQAASAARDYDRFWQQLLLWLGARSRPGGITTERSGYQPGEPVVIRAPGAGPAAQLVIRTSDGGERTQALTSSADRTGATATIATTPATTWVEAELRQGGAVQSALRVLVRSTGLEDDFCQLDRPRLESLAATTGGQVIDAADLALVDTLAAPEVRVERRREARSLWHLHALFWIMLACYGAELLLRRRWLLT